MEMRRTKESRFLGWKEREREETGRGSDREGKEKDKDSRIERE